MQEPNYGTPSTAEDSSWLTAKRKKGKYPPHSSWGGKWLVFTTTKYADELWNRIAFATEEGLLGGSSKVSTAMQTRRSRDADSRVICVYTYDWCDEDDVKRVREQLRALGVTRSIPYKADSDTQEGIYAADGHQDFTKYFE